MAEKSVPTREDERVTHAQIKKRRKKGGKPKNDEDIKMEGMSWPVG